MPAEAAAREGFEDLDAKWGGQCPAISKLGRNALSGFVPFLDWDVEIRRIWESPSVTATRIVKTATPFLRPATHDSFTVCGFEYQEEPR